METIKYIATASITVVLKIDNRDIHRTDISHDEKIICSVDPIELFRNMLENTFDEQILPEVFDKFNRLTTLIEALVNEPTDQWAEGKE